MTMKHDQIIELYNAGRTIVLNNAKGGRVI